MISLDHIGFILMATTCFFYVSPNVSIPALFSFPTRRSSDLLASLSWKALILVSGQWSVYSVKMTVKREYTFKQLVHFGMRSEEHTSELQSRGHLVCRLLLGRKEIGQVRGVSNGGILSGL